MIDWGWGETLTRTEPSSRCIRGTCYAHKITSNVNLDHLAMVVVPKFLHWEVAVFPYFVLNMSLTPPIPRERRLGIVSYKENYLHVLFGILSGRLVSSSIYLPLNLHVFLLFWVTT
jgi:hypothetical protein